MKNLITLVAFMFLASPVFAYENVSEDCASLADSTIRDVKVIDSSNPSSDVLGSKIVTE